MRHLEASEINSCIDEFDNSNYTNSHLDWIELTDLYRFSGSIWLDEINKNKYLSAILPNTADIFWLHSFYSTAYPDHYPLSEKLKQCFSPGNYSIYTISSHTWYNTLLEKNGFRKCDDIIQLETDAIHEILPFSDFPVTQLTLNEIDQVRCNCESSFAPLWRLGLGELTIAIKSSNYARIIKSGNKVLAYLLADYESDNCHIERIAVSQDSQRKGLAAALFHQLVLDMQKLAITKFSVNTNHNNTSALKFYEKMNFEILGKKFPVYHRFLRVNRET